MAYTRVDEFFYMGAIEAIAARKVYKQFMVNRFELSMLYSLSAYLQLHGRRSAGRKMLTDWLGLSYRLEKRAWAYIEGLITKGAVNKMTFKNKANGYSLSISPFGGKVLTCYGHELLRLEAKDSIRKKQSGYTDLIVSEELPYYTIIKLGRSA
jgi:hypothetical protein